MTGVESGPSSIGELLERTFSLYRHSFAVFVGMMIPPSLLSALGGLAFVMVQPRLTAWSPPDLDPVETLLFLAAIGFFAISSIIVTSAAMAATALAVSEIHLGRGATTARCYLMMGRRFWGVVGLSLILTAIMFVGSMISILAGAIVGLALGLIHRALILLGLPVAFAGIAITAVWLIRYGVAVQALMLERLSAPAALRRSAQLTQGFRLRVVLIVFLMLMIGYVAAFIFQGPFFVAGYLLMEEGVIPVWIQALQIISGSIGGALSGPPLAIGMALFYFDLRLRKEGLDLLRP